MREAKGKGNINEKQEKFYRLHQQRRMGLPPSGREENKTEEKNEEEKNEEREK